MKQTRSKRSTVIAALAVVTSLAALSACSDSKDATSTTVASTTPGTGSTATTPATTEPLVTSPLGEDNKASGDPIKLGFITDGKTAGSDASAESPAAKAAADYANDHLAGIAGRPIELDICETQGTAAGAEDCVSQLASDGVVAILQNLSAQNPAVRAATAASGLPYFAYGVSPSNDPSSYTMLNTISITMAGPAKMAQDAGYDKVGYLIIDVPAATGSYKTILPGIYESAGVEAITSFVPIGTADMTPQVQSLMSEGVQQIMVVGLEDFCLAALKAMSSLGFEGTRIVYSGCFTAAVAAGVPGGVDGVVYTALASIDPTDPEIILYNEVMNTYASGAATDGVAQGAYAVVVAFVRALAGLDGDVTTATIDAALKAMPPTPWPLAAGLTFQCDGKQSPDATSVCTTGVVAVTVDAEGKPKSSENLEVSEIYAGVQG